MFGQERRKKEAQEVKKVQVAKEEKEEARKKKVKSCKKASSTVHFNWMKFFFFFFFTTITSWLVSEQYEMKQAPTAFLKSLCALSFWQLQDEKRTELDHNARTGAGPQHRLHHQEPNALKIPRIKGRLEQKLFTHASCRS